MFITNAEAEYVPKELVYLLYTLRWQIELILKVWKSIYSIDKLKSVKLERFLCHLYGTLISILVSSKLVFSVRNNIENHTYKEISEFKTFKTVHTFLISIGAALLKSFLGLKFTLKKILEVTLKNGLKSKRKPKKSSLEILKLLNLESELKIMKIA